MWWWRYLIWDNDLMLRNATTLHPNQNAPKNDTATMQSEVWIQNVFLQPTVIFSKKLKRTLTVLRMICSWYLLEYITFVSGLMHPCISLNRTPDEVCWTYDRFWLTHWGRDKMDAISQTTFSNGFSWMKMFEFRLKFHWILVLRVQLTVFHHWFR